MQEDMHMELRTVWDLNKHVTPCALGIAKGTTKTAKSRGTASITSKGLRNYVHEVHYITA